MKKPFHRLILAALCLCLGASCTTAYDAHGRPRQVVDPGAALLGAAVVGLVAYGIASSNNDDRRDRRHCNTSGYRGGRRCYY